MADCGCQLRDAKSCGVLGGLYQEGRGVPKDMRRAAKLYEKACTGGEGAACGRLGVMLQKGEGITKDMKRAAENYERACKAGYSGGCTLLADLKKAQS